MTHSYAWLALHSLKKVSIKNKLALVEVLGSAESVMCSSASTLTALKVPQSARQAILDYQLGRGALIDAVTIVRTWLQDADDHHLLSYSDNEYPALLKEMPDPPLALMVKGNIKLLQQPQIAIVGSRRASRQGIENAKMFASALASSGVVVTSGLALGIDAAAHRATLASASKTVAVLGTGPDLAYPNQNKQLYTDIINHGGALITEFLPGAPPRAIHFPKRNRIIAGLTQGVLVIEAAVKSGSLITARLSLEYNREVFALPGSIHSIQSQGCNSLIRDGAQLINSVEQILEQLGHMVDMNFQEHHCKDHKPDSDCLLSEAGLLILEKMQWDALTVDEIASLVLFQAAELMPQLALLEIEGLVAKTGDRYQRLVSDD